MRTLIDVVKNNKPDCVISEIAKIEAVKEISLRKDIRSGYTVIPKNKKRTLKKPCGIGRSLRTKVNVNIGVSPGCSSINEEIKKMNMSVSLGADTVMDLSVGDGVNEIRRKIIEKCPVPIGTVPVYEAAIKRRNVIEDIEENDLIDVLRSQAEEGVDFFTIHSGVTKNTVKILDRSKRLINIVSRGGAILYKWIKINRKENPYYSRFDEILDIASEYDITLSLGDGMRPGTILDANDASQMSELELLGELHKKALKKGVQSIIEGPGHVPINKIKESVDLEKKLCGNAPFYVLGPLVTDIAPGYDHITAAIGGAIAAQYGADFLCYVTPAEHLRLPTIEDVREGLIASKIAAHAADLAKGIKNEWSKDREISTARRKRQWRRQFECAIDKEKALSYRDSRKPKIEDVCTMCGEYCPLKISE